MAEQTMQPRRVGDAIEVIAPAKVNLFLEILGQRPDGFHELETLMTPVNLLDQLSIVDDPSGRLSMRCHWAPGFVKRRSTFLPGSNPSIAGHGSEELPQDDRNIALRALRLLRDRSGVERGASLTILKRIPSAAGLGGGSSDGAAALVAANELWQLRWPRQRLAELAAELGSDVPFFLWSTTAICRGRGERIEPIQRPFTLHLVIACPPVGLSTAAVYRTCQAPTAGDHDRFRSVEPVVDALATGNHRRLAGALFNRLQPAAASLSPWINRLRDAFADQGSACAQMSGSGTSYFGVCQTASHAARLAARLRATGLERVFCVASL